MPGPLEVRPGGKFALELLRLRIGGIGSEGCGRLPGGLNVIVASIPNCGEACMSGAERVGLIGAGKRSGEGDDFLEGIGGGGPSGVLEQVFASLQLVVDLLAGRHGGQFSGGKRGDGALQLEELFEGERKGEGSGLLGASRGGLGDGEVVDDGGEGQVFFQQAPEGDGLGVMAEAVFGQAGGKDGFGILGGGGRDFFENGGGGSIHDITEIGLA